MNDKLSVYPSYLFPYLEQKLREAGIILNVLLFLLFNVFIFN